GLPAILALNNEEGVVDAVLLASELGFPEGPVIMPDLSVVLCDGNTGELRRWNDGELEVYAHTGGSPWGALLGTDGAIYVTQGGNVPGSGDTSAICGIQVVRPDRTVELISSEIGGHTLAGPNDLAFGPDGRLYFTDSGTEEDPRHDPGAPGRLFVLDSSGGEFLMERPMLYPNGIAFDAAGSLYWTESRAHRVCRLQDGEPTVFCQLTDNHVPDGFAFADDGRLFVCTTISNSVTTVSPTGEILEEIEIGGHPTNCIFDGSTLYVTASHGPDLDAQGRDGTFWRVETDATGLALRPGQL
ncbi:MAG TPA: SMP-30/gluconolactonase/LRE family protein, partial [Solirubrobacteraceae bacterium]|nr:SMP-30/gluconolactonase/LRE family protein [Solirubrobacteraceae bacterium]